jgi:hypothetical protein
VWGDRYAAYAFNAGITTGVNNEHTLFASDRSVTFQEFTALLLRVLGYSEAKGDFIYEQAIQNKKALTQGCSTCSTNQHLLQANTCAAMPYKKWLTLLKPNRKTAIRS